MRSWCHQMFLCAGFSDPTDQHPLSSPLGRGGLWNCHSWFDIEKLNHWVLTPVSKYSTQSQGSHIPRWESMSLVTSPIRHWICAGSPHPFGPCPESKTGFHIMCRAGYLQVRAGFSSFRGPRVWKLRLSLGAGGIILRQEASKSPNSAGMQCHWTCALSHFSHVWLFATPWTIARQSPLSMGFFRQEH